MQQTLERWSIARMVCKQQLVLWKITLQFPVDHCRQALIRFGYALTLYLYGAATGKQIIRYHNFFLKRS
jgi:hypothetical protein